MLTNAGASVAATDRDGLTGNTHLFFRFFFAVHHHAFQKLKKKRWNNLIWTRLLEVYTRQNPVILFAIHQRCIARRAGVTAIAWKR